MHKKTPSGSTSANTYNASAPLESTRGEGSASERAGCDTAITFLRERVAPIAQELDQNLDTLKDTFHAFRKAGLLAPEIPDKFGGRQWSRTDLCTLKVETTRASGALSFVALQQHGATGIIVGSNNHCLAERLLPEFARGTSACGIAFGHLRWPISPLQASRCEGGYSFNGRIPWATGYGMYEQILVAAPCESGDIVYAIVNFEAGERVHVGTPMQLATLSVSQTVELHLNEVVIPDTHIAQVISPNEFARRDESRAATHGYYSIGCSLGAIDYLETVRSRTPQLDEAIHHARVTVTDQRRILEADESDIAIRTEIFETMRLLTALCVTATGGAANLMSHPAQRLYREAIAWTLLGLGPRLRTTAVTDLCEKIVTHSGLHRA